jgi:hypothetical protein
MGWKEAAEGGQSEKIPNGKHDQLRVTKILRGSKKTPQFVSDKGVPQMALIITDREDREVMDMITLNDANMWKLAQYLAAMGADLDGMDRDGVTVENFKDEIFALKQLIDRPFAAEIRPDDKNTQYTKVVPFKRSSPAAVDADEIPI